LCTLSISPKETREESARGGPGLENETPKSFLRDCPTGDQRKKVDRSERAMV